MPPIDLSRLHVGQVSADAIIPLRHRMLRQGLPLDSARFPGDDDQATLHFAASESGVPVCCLTLMAAEWEGRDAWQLRGMATASEFQGQGVGRRLFVHAMAEARRKSPERLMWCNARVSAIGFYERVGWGVVSGEFEIPLAGPHVKMVYRGE